MSAAVVLVFRAHAGALPTTAGCEQRLAVQASVVSVDALRTYSVNESARLTSWTFADAAHVFSRPTDIFAYYASPQNLAYSTIKQNKGVRNLPAVPGAFLMGIVGFLCISLVRDRKAWVSIFVVIVVLSQVGVKTLCKLTAPHLVRGRLSNKQAAALASVKPIPVDNSFNWFSNLGNCHCLGLLRRLAASLGDSAFGDIRQGTYRRNAEQQLSDLRVFYTRQDTVTSQPAIVPVQHSFNSLVGSLAERIISIAYFSPAFVFGNLARSPPILD